MKAFNSRTFGVVSLSTGGDRIVDDGEREGGQEPILIAESSPPSLVDAALDFLCRLGLRRPAASA